MGISEGKEGLAKAGADVLKSVVTPHKPFTFFQVCGLVDAFSFLASIVAQAFSISITARVVLGLLALFLFVVGFVLFRGLWIWEGPKWEASLEEVRAAPGPPPGPPSGETDGAGAAPGTGDGATVQDS